MTYNNDHWRKWTPQPREAPAWLKQMQYENAKQQEPTKRVYPWDKHARWVVLALFALAAYTFLKAWLLS